MRDTVEVDIERSAARVAALYADPTNNTKWMDDIARCDLQSGRTGAPGSKYRLIPTKGSMIFDVTVVAVELPQKVELRLVSQMTTVDVRTTFTTLPSGVTRLRSEETFTFHGWLNRILGALARLGIRKAHSRQMNGFRRFAELGPR